MKTNKEMIIEDVREKIIRGMKLNRKRLIKIKKSKNSVLVVYEKGKIVKIKP